MKTWIRLAMLAFIAPLSLAAGASGMPAAKTAAAPKAAGPMVLAPAKHNGSGVELRYAAPPSMQPGVAATVRIALSGVTADGATVELRGDDPSVQLRIDGQPVSGPITLARGETRTIDVQVSAPDGMQYLNVFTSQNGRTSAHSIALKVGSGAPTAKANGTLKTLPNGEKIISLPSK